MVDTVSTISEYGRNRQIDSSEAESCPCEPINTRKPVFSTGDGYESKKRSKKKRATLKKGIKGVQKWNKMSAKDSRKVIMRPCQRVLHDLSAFIISSLGTVSKLKLLLFFYKSIDLIFLLKQL